MDRGDLFDLFDVLPRRAQRRVVAVVAVVVTTASVVVPGLRLREHVVGWVVEGYTEQISERLEDALSRLVPSPPAAELKPGG